MATSIDQEIADWDGKSAEIINAIYERYSNSPNFIHKIIKLIKKNDQQKGATWLLKKWLESKNQLNSNSIKNTYNSLELLAHWESKLHILQCIPFMPIGKNEREKVERFLRENLTDSNKFVRAWSYNGFYELALQYPEYTSEVQQFFKTALKDEAASVKARIRNIAKQGF